MISEQATGFPGYNSIIPEDKVTIRRMLKDNGYATAWFGKNHNTPAFAASQVGPFEKWPSGMGFEYFYGFNGGAAHNAGRLTAMVRVLLQAIRQWIILDSIRGKQHVAPTLPWKRSTVYFN